MSSYKALLSIFSKDRVGLISSVTAYLFDCGINLGDTSFAILGKGGEFSSILDIPEDLEEALLRRELLTLDGLRDADITIKRFSLTHSDAPPSRITHHVVCDGEDQPGLLARLSEVLMDFDANIVQLKAEQVVTDGHTHYLIRFSAYIP